MWILIFSEINEAMTTSWPRKCALHELDIWVFNLLAKHTKKKTQPKSTLYFWFYFCLGIIILVCAVCEWNGGVADGIFSCKRKFRERQVQTRVKSKSGCIWSHKYNKPADQHMPLCTIWHIVDVYSREESLIKEPRVNLAHQGFSPNLRIALRERRAHRLQ